MDIRRHFHLPPNLITVHPLQVLFPDHDLIGIRIPCENPTQQSTHLCISCAALKEINGFQVVNHGSLPNRYVPQKQCGFNTPINGIHTSESKLTSIPRIYIRTTTIKPFRFAAHLQKVYKSYLRKGLPTFRKRLLRSSETAIWHGMSDKRSQPFVRLSFILICSVRHGPRLH